MALSDLTPEQRKLVEETLLSPPPESFQPTEAFIDPMTRAQAASGMLGSAGRFIEQLAREQDKRAEENRVANLAREAASISPLDPEYQSKIQRLALKDPAAFATAPVQQALNVIENQKKVAQQQAEQQILQGVPTMPPEERESFMRSGSLIARENLPYLQKMEQQDIEREAALSELPEFKRPKEPVSSFQAKQLAKKFTESLPPALQKVKGFENRKYVLELAKNWKARKEQEGKEGVKEGLPQSDSILAEITATLGMDPNRNYVSEDTVNSILKAADKFGMEAATPPAIAPQLQEEIDVFSEFNTATAP